MSNRYLAKIEFGDYTVKAKGKNREEARKKLIEKVDDSPVFFPPEIKRIKKVIRGG